MPLTRILEAESFDGMLIFVRTKTATVELAEKLQARGYSSSALNGDIAQNQRERTIQQLKDGKIDILVATDVAARGLDVDRISHVINYDIPYDTEAYVHRIGRTGRAGRTGDAILFVAPREKRMLSAIEKATRKKIEIMELPSTKIINDKRIVKFKQRITDTLAHEDLALFSQLVEQYQQEHNVPAVDIGAALAKLLQGNAPLLLANKPNKTDRKEKSSQTKDKSKRSSHTSMTPDDLNPPEPGQERYRIEVGHNHKVKPGNIVGAIVNEAGLESKYIGQIKIFDDYSLVDLPEGMPKEIYKDLRKTWVSGQQLRITKLGSEKKQRKPRARKENTKKRTSTSTCKNSASKRKPIKKKHTE